MKIHTISQFLEAVPESTHASLYEVIYQDGNLLKWRKGQSNLYEAADHPK